VGFREAECDPVRAAGDLGEQVKPVEKKGIKNNPASSKDFWRRSGNIFAGKYE